MSSIGQAGAAASDEARSQEGKIDLEAEYELPKKLFTKGDEAFVMRFNEHEADTVLANLKTKLEV